jgi:hypothetical protein
MHANQVSDEEKRTQKAREAEEKAAARQEKEAKKEKEAEEKRMAKEEKRKSREAPKAAAVDTTGATYTAKVTSGDDEEAARTATETSPTSPTSPKSESKGIKSLLNKLKRRSKPASPTDTESKGFIGGVALRNSESQSQSQTQSHPGSITTSPPANPTHIPTRRDSDVSSIASEPERGRSTERISTISSPQPERTTTGLSEVSDVSRPEMERKTTGYSDVSEYEEARDDFNEALAPPPTFTTSEEVAARKGSPSRDSRFHEVGI